MLVKISVLGSNMRVSYALERINYLVFILHTIKQKQLNYVLDLNKNRT